MFGTRARDVMGHISSNGSPTALPERPRRQKQAKTACPVIIGSKRGGGQACSRVVAQACDNHLCKRHCEHIGHCRIHTTVGEPGEDGEDVLAYTRAKPADPVPGANLYPSEGSGWLDHTNEEQASASTPEVFLPMPPPSQDILDACEQRDINMALEASLNPVSWVSHSHPYVTVPSFASGSGSSGLDTASSTSTNLFDSAFGTASAVSESEPPSPAIPVVQVSPHLLSAKGFADHLRTESKHIPLLKAPTSRRALPNTLTHGDRIADRSSAFHNPPVPTIDARLSKHMSPLWLNQFEKREETRAQSIQDGEQQKAFRLRCQRQFLLKFFNAVSH
jgi:hypothetical protein